MIDLSKFCDPTNPRAEKLDGIIMKPYRVTLDDGQVWTAATDGKVIVAVRDDRWGLSVATGKAEKTLQDFLAVPPLEDAVLPLAELKTFLEHPVWEVPCPECQGISKGSEYVHCSFCEGDGTMQPEPRPGYLIGVPIDRQRLARCLEELEGSEVSLRRFMTDQIHLSTPDWRVVIKGMNDKSSAEDIDWNNAPKFGEYLCRSA